MISSNVFYVGGTLKGTAPTPAYTAPSTQPFYLGGAPPPNYVAGDLFRGKIACLGYINRTISTNEMTQIRTNIQSRFGLPVQ